MWLQDSELTATVASMPAAYLADPQARNQGGARGRSPS